MTATPGTNSYVDEAAADTYFADKYGTAAWTAASSADKNGALVSATQVLDHLCEWYGNKASDSQALEFPRNYSDANPVPQDVKDAQCEIALNIITEASVSQDSGDALEELKAGSVTLKFKATGAKNPLATQLALDLLAEYGLCQGGGSTRMIPVTRG